MRWLYRHLIRPALFSQAPEDIHEQALRTLGWVSRHRLVCEAMSAIFSAPLLPIRVFGLEFPNPVGLGAGMDKEGAAVPAWAALGFGFTELGAVTWQAQPGNPRPRIFRAIPAEAIVNRMGFNNPGAAVVAETLASWRNSGGWPPHPVGVNLGKSKVTPLDRAAEDYAASLRTLGPHVDFFVINVSSPNTPNLRELQDRSALDEILAACQEANHPQAKPILVKVAPDLSFEALDQIVELVEPRGLAGLVATNTTITRPETNDPGLRAVYAEAGGLSGRPLRSRSTEVIRHLYRQTGGRVPLIGVGGIFAGGDAWEKIAAGASLVQIYTGFVFEGPTAARTIVQDLRRRLAACGLAELRQAVGLAHRQPVTG